MDVCTCVWMCVHVCMCVGDVWMCVEGEETHKHHPRLIMTEQCAYKECV